MKNLFLVIILSCLIGILYGQKRYTISGKIKDKTSGEELIGAIVFIKELKTGTVSNNYGFYSITLQQGEYNIVVSYIGYSSIEKTISLEKNVVYNFEMEPVASMMKEVVIEDKRLSENVTSNEMSLVKMKMNEIKKIPALMGEVDLIKAIQMLPGIQSAGEGSSGFSVRGGSTDQNLILLDEAPVYNASHLFGFFSVFNNDAVKDITLYKGDIPVMYGGRISSLLDVRQKDGNMKKITGCGGIGSISSRIAIEGPIKRDTSSFIIAARRSYADLFLPFAKNKDLRKNKLYFYDANFKVNYIFSQKDRIFLSGYFGRDMFKVNMTDKFSMSWGNYTVTLRWNHIFNEKLFSNYTLISSNYNYELDANITGMGFKWLSELKDYSLKSDFGYYLNTNNTVKFGIVTTMHKFSPAKIEGYGENNIFNTIETPKISALEHSLYLSNEQKLSSRISFNYGIRYTLFQNIGPATVYKFNDKYVCIDTVEYNDWNIYNTYSGMEPRINGKYSLTENSSIKFACSKTMQFLQLASNSTVGTPLDIWVPSSQQIKPQKAMQYTLGYFRNFKRNIIESSIEFYYKDMRNQIDFRDFAYLLLNPQIEGEFRFGKGKAYGVEFLIRKQTGKLTGWTSYTLSKSERKITGINGDRWYRSPYDKTHNVNIVLMYQLNKRVQLSINWVYTTGAPVTFPTGRYTYGALIAPVYSDRNSYRLPAYHRLDLAVSIEGKEKPGRKYKGGWNISIYNLYSRHNAYQITFRQNKEYPEITEAIKTYLFPIIPSITYNFNF